MRRIGLGLFLSLFAAQQVGILPQGGFGVTAEQKEILRHMSIVFLDDGSGQLVNKTIRLSGVNWQIVNGLGSTTTQNGVGNLVVGYNETGNLNGDTRTGSHNVVFGTGASYSRHGGCVGGRDNSITAAFATVTGGARNVASGVEASISGGLLNSATDYGSAVSGGRLNTSSGYVSSVTGGVLHRANGYGSTISGGMSNTALGILASVTGGRMNTVIGIGTAVHGGQANTAMGLDTSVGGGQFNTTDGIGSSVSGGSSRSALGTSSWAAGNLYETY